jgi:hypothetical protein
MVRIVVDVTESIAFVDQLVHRIASAASGSRTRARRRLRAFGDTVSELARDATSLLRGAELTVLLERKPGADLAQWGDGYRMRSLSFAAKKAHVAKPPRRSKAGNTVSRGNSGRRSDRNGQAPGLGAQPEAAASAP